MFGGFASCIKNKNGRLQRENKAGKRGNTKNKK